MQLMARGLSVSLRGSNSEALTPLSTITFHLYPRKQVMPTVIARSESVVDVSESRGRVEKMIRAVHASRRRRQTQTSRQCVSW